MRMLSRTALLTVVCATLLAGCSGEESGEPEPAGGDGQSNEQPSDSGSPSGQPDGGDQPAPPNAPTSAELLGQTDLPPNTRFQQLDVAQLNEQLVKVAEQSTFDPPECGKLQTKLYEQLTKDNGSVQGLGTLALSGAGSIAESVLLKPEQFTLPLNDDELKTCRNLRTTTAGQTTSAKITPLKLSGVDADEVFAFRQEVNFGQGRGALTQTSVSMTTPSRIVTLGLSGPTKPSASEVSAIAKKALAKVKR